MVQPKFFKTQFEFINQIKKWGFSTNPYNKLTKGLDAIEKQHKYVEELRSSLDYDIDGLVYKVNDLNICYLWKG